MKNTNSDFGNSSSTRRDEVREKPSPEILIVSQYFPPETGAAASRMGDLAKYLNQNGFKVNVLTEIPNYPHGKFSKGYNLRWCISEKWNNILVKRVFVIPTKRKTFFQRLVYFGSFFFSSLIVGLRLQKMDYVIATSPPPLVGITGWILSRRYRAKYVLDIRDLWPMAVVELSDLKSSLVINLLKYVERFLYDKSDLTTIAVPGFRKYINQNDSKSVRIWDFPNGVNSYFLESKPKQTDLPELENLDGKFIVLFSGNHGLAYDLEMILGAALQLKKNPDIHFLFVGEGISKPDIELIANNNSLPNVTFVTSQPRESMPSIIHRAQVCLLPLKKVPYLKKALPSSMFEYLACKKPIIVTIEGEAEKVLLEANAGLIIESGNIFELIDAIIFLFEHKNKRKAMGENGYRFVRNHYNQSHILEGFCNALRAIPRIDP